MYNKLKVIFIVLTSLAIIAAPSSGVAGGGHSHDHGHDHGDDHDEPTKGPHGGKLLVDGDFALELTIFERGVPPQFRVFLYNEGKPIKPQEATVNIGLIRFGAEKSYFELTSTEDYLTSQVEVVEPHSFEVSIVAKYKGREFNWRYESHEGRTELSSEALKIAKLGFDTAGPREISNSARVYGRLLANEDKVAHLGPRFPGVVREIKKMLGDIVTKGELLAIIESNQSLQPYEIRSYVAGVVVKRHATLGEFVSDSRELFVVADLSEIWADFQVYRDDFGPITKGQSIVIDLGGGREVPAKVSYVAPLTDEATQSRLVRAVLPNPDGALRPGLFVSGVLSSTQITVPIAVTRDAIQTFRDWNVVYLTDGNVFQAMPVELGRRDGQFVEILSGIESGARYVSRNSFIIKADIEKAGATHDH